jgi:hypothetical protein
MSGAIYHNVISNIFRKVMYLCIVNIIYYDIVNGMCICFPCNTQLVLFKNIQCKDVDKNTDETVMVNDSPNIN